MTDTLNSRAAAFLRESRYDDARALYTEVIEQGGSGLVFAFHQRGLCLGGLGEFALAVEDFSQAIQRNTDEWSSSFCARGQCHYELRHIEEALSDLTEALRLQRNDATAYHYRARCYRRQGMLELALSDISRAIDLTPEAGACYNVRGLIYKDMDDLDSSLRDFNRALRLGEMTGSVLKNRGDCYRRRREFDKSLRDLNHSISMTPEDPRGYGSRGLCYEVMGRFTEAILDFEKAIELDDGYLRKRLESCLVRVREKFQVNEEEPINPHSQQREAVFPGLLESSSLSVSRGDCLGSGSFGRVVHGLLQMEVASSVREVVSIPVAVKLLPLDASRRMTRESVLREVSMMKEISFPGCLTCYGCCFATSPDGVEEALVVTELCREKNVFEWLLDRKSEFDPSGHIRIPVLLQIAEAIFYLHTHSPKPIVHNDLKPANVLVSLDGKQVKVADYGSSAHLQSLRPAAFIGTLVYIPNQEFVTFPDKRSRDTYAYSMMCFELWTCTRVLQRPEYVELYEQCGEDEFGFVQEIHRRGLRPSFEGVDIPSPLQELLTECWADHPRDRPDFRMIVDRLSQLFPSSRLLHAIAPQIEVTNSLDQLFEEDFVRPPQMEHSLFEVFGPAPEESQQQRLVDFLASLNMTQYLDALMRQVDSITELDELILHEDLLESIFPKTVVRSKFVRKVKEKMGHEC